MKYLLTTLLVASLPLSVSANDHHGSMDHSMDGHDHASMNHDDHDHAAMNHDDHDHAAMNASMTIMIIQQWTIRAMT